jgi:hypothetical protein
MEQSTHATMKQENKSRPKETGISVQVRLQAGPLAAVDDWRRKQPDLPNRPEAIRRLIEQALGAKKAR